MSKGKSNVKKNKYIQLLLERLIDLSHEKIRQSQIVEFTAVECRRRNRLKAGRRSLLVLQQMAGKSSEASFLWHSHTAGRKQRSVLK
jgi:hypothetical protein